MSFLADPPLLYATGRLYGRAAPPEDRRARPLAAATLGVFWGTSVALYLDRRWTTPLWRAMRARSGRDWMVNSGVLRLDPDGVGPRGHVIAALIFATYPLWLALGYRRGREARAG